MSERYGLESTHSLTQPTAGDITLHAVMLVMAKGRSGMKSRQFQSPEPVTQADGYAETYKSGCPILPESND